MAKLRHAMTCGACPVRTCEAFGEGNIANVMEFVLDPSGRG